MKWLDALIDRVTMYRLLMYFLIATLGTAMLLGAFGLITYNPYSIFATTSLLVGTSWLTNFIFARVFNAPSNPNSSILSGLILALVATPITAPEGAPFLIAIAALAIASKYILAINHKHIFNPVAIAAVLMAFGPQETVSWWVGTSLLAPVVLIGGALVARKIRRGRMVSIFFGVALAAIVVGALATGRDPLATIQTTILHSSLLFLGFVMLTEPLTSPSTRTKQWIYASVVGILFVPQLHIGSIYTTPELALVVGNLVSFLITPRVKTLLKLKSHNEKHGSSEDFIFQPEKPFAYKPGQYVEITLPHGHADSRGSRRYFTLASSPTESDIRVGIRFYQNGSTFKQALASAGDDLFASVGQLGGEFTLPKDPTRKVAFIAGGIGITPFRSMIKYMSDTNDKRPAVLLYGERTVGEVAYSDVFEEARQKIGVKTSYVINDGTAHVDPNIVTGRVDAAMIQAQVPDYPERLFYISGPQSMVHSMRQQLIQIGVKRRDIKTDYFSGYAS